MKKTTFLFLITFQFILFSQDRTEYFEFIKPEKPQTKSYYNSIKLIDNRLNKANLGFIQKGAFNKRFELVEKNSMESQVQELFNAINVSNQTAENKELILYLKKFNFSEITGAMSENGYCDFEAILFSKNRDEYHFVAEIDTLINHSSLDVTKAIIKKGSGVVEDFLTKNLHKPILDQTTYTYDQVLQFDDIRKQKLKLYNATVLTDGLYQTFQDFINQTPNEKVPSVELNENQNKILKAYFLNEKGKKIKLEKNKYYGMVYKGQPFIYLQMENYFVLAEKKENDFYFEAKATTSSSYNPSAVVMAGAMFGLIGSLAVTAATSSGSSVYYNMKLNYQKGTFIPISEVK